MIKQGLACALLASSLLFMGGSDACANKPSDTTIVTVYVTESETFATLPEGGSIHIPESGEYVPVKNVIHRDEYEYGITPDKIRLDKDVPTESDKVSEEAAPETEKTENQKAETPQKESPKKDVSENKKPATKPKNDNKTEAKIPSPLSDEQFALMLAEAEKYLGYEYVWGGSTPKTSFDCSGYVTWVVNNSGIGMNIGRINSKSIYKICTKVSATELKPGDLVFFKGTYATTGVSHVGIYVGGGKMIHCGSSVEYADLSDSYWRSHFYAYGRLPNP